jgi:hypothetical protein
MIALAVSTEVGSTEGRRTNRDLLFGSLVLAYPEAALAKRSLVFYLMYCRAASR